jgi:alkanesulfonate monooxygenase SsuD/methylene tetrahydromethanopterin reductase-like flavin-dependent oxidoreductase (luciferase family)
MSIGSRQIRRWGRLLGSVKGCITGGITMKFGLLLSCPPSVPPYERFGFLRQLATRADQAGFEIIAAGQHFADRDQQALQPLPLLAALAPMVSLKLMTGVLLGPLLPPLAVAEAFMTLDLISGGRTVLGVGAGHRAAEFEGFGVPERDRGQRLEQFVLDVRRLWSDEAEAGGSQVRISIPPSAWRTPPIWVAASSDAGVRRAARIGNAWYVGPGTPLTTLARQLDVYRGAVSAVGGQLPAVQPIRRDIFVSTSRAKRSDLSGILRRRYESQHSWGYSLDLPPKVRQARAQVLDGRASLNGILGEEVIAGSPQECAAQLTRVCQVVNGEALVILRAGWPAASGAELLSELDTVLEVCAAMPKT